MQKVITTQSCSQRRPKGHQPHQRRFRRAATRQDKDKTKENKDKTTQDDSKHPAQQQQKHKRKEKSSLRWQDSSESTRERRRGSVSTNRDESTRERRRRTGAPTQEETKEEEGFTKPFAMPKTSRAIEFWPPTRLKRHQPEPSRLNDRKVRE